MSLPLELAALTGCSGRGPADAWTLSVLLFARPLRLRGVEAPGTARDSEAAEAVEPEAKRGFSAGLNLKGTLRQAMEAPPTVYEIVGGREFFDELVERFYDAVSADALLRPMYPRDLAPARRRLAGFLAQYWGGPPHYSDERGHPRLRMRHLPFTIGEAERDAWMRHMTASLDAATVADGSGRPLPAEIRAAMFDHFDNAATHLLNTPEN